MSEAHVRPACWRICRSFIAGITLPNEASIALHTRFGFSPVGTMRRVGCKFDRYWDVGWYERLRAE